MQSQIKSEAVPFQKLDLLTQDSRLFDHNLTLSVKVGSVLSHHLGRLNLSLFHLCIFF
jgi:hypothetical protein